MPTMSREAVDIRERILFSCQRSLVVRRGRNHVLVMANWYMRRCLKYRTRTRCLIIRNSWINFIYSYVPLELIVFAILLASLRVSIFLIYVPFAVFLILIVPLRLLAFHSNCDSFATERILLFNFPFPTYISLLFTQRNFFSREPFAPMKNKENSSSSLILNFAFPRIVEYLSSNA